MSMPLGMVVQIPKELYWLAVWIYRLICIRTMVNVDAALVRQELGQQHVRSGKGWARHYPYNPNQKERTHQSIMENVSQAITCSNSHNVFFLMNWTEKLHTRENLLMLEKYKAHNRCKNKQVKKRRKGIAIFSVVAVQLHDAFDPMLFCDFTMNLIKHTTC